MATTGRNEIELLIKARDEASKTLVAINAELKKMGVEAEGAGSSLEEGGRHASTFTSRVIEMAASFGLAEVAVSAFEKSIIGVIQAARRGIQAVDDMKIAQASLAAAGASADISVPFDKAYSIAGKMLLKIEELDSKFIGTNEELVMLADSMTTFGMGIDLSTKKSQEQFVAFGNLLKLTTRGSNFQRQVFQEVKSLVEAQNVQGAMLVKRIEAAGINAQVMIPIWREQGTLLENVLKLMSGYADASDEVGFTLQAQKATLETITTMILREGMAGAYEDIRDAIKYINDALYDQGELTEKAKLLALGLDTAWQTVKATVEAIAWLIDNTILAGLKKAVEGGAIAYNAGLAATGEGLIDITGGPGSPLTDEQKELIANMQEERRDKALRDTLGYEGSLKFAGQKKGEDPEARAKKREEALKRYVKSMDEYVKGMEAYFGTDAATERGEIAYLKRLDKLREEDRKSREKSVQQIGKNYEDELALSYKQREEFARWMEDLEGLRRYAEEPIDWPWLKLEAPEIRGARERFKQVFEDINRDVRTGRITPEQGQEALARAAQVRDRQLQKLEELHDEHNQRIAAFWDETVTGMHSLFSDLFVDGLAGELQSASDYFRAFTDIVRRAWGNLLADMLTKWLANQAKMAFGGQGGGLSFGSILSWAGGLLGSGGGAPATQIDALDAFYTARDGGVLPGGFRAFAGGGIVRRPTLGLVGEGGEDEAVIPLKGGKVPVELRGGGGGSPTVVFQINAADRKDLDRIIMERRSLWTSIIRQEIANGGMLRDTIRKYGGR